MATSLEQPDHPAPAAVALRTDTLVDSVLILLSMTVVQRLVGFARAVLFCRWLQPEELGRWDMAFGFLMLAAPLAVLAVPGVFGRYVERYRQRDQLRAFLRQTILACVLLAAVSMLIVHACRTWFSELIFGKSDQTELVSLMAVCLVVVAANNFFLELFSSLRNVRVVSIMQMIGSVSFAVLGAVLLAGWQCTATGVVLAFGGSLLVAVAVGCWCLRRSWKALPPDHGPLARRDLWSKLTPFAGWILLTALLVNLFGIVDRYMILHFSTMSPDEALVQVGNYHSSRIVPLLLVSVTMLLGTMITPHLSRDWEMGHRERTASQLRLFLKLFGFCLAAAAVAVIVAAPLLFGVALKNKFAGGLAVLPWTLTYCTWFGMVLLAENYLFCAEKARLVSVALGVGLAANVVLNLLLLPPLGLLGAVLATTAANLVVLVLICTFNHMLGFRLDRGTVVILALPLSVCLGPWLALLALTAVVYEAVCTERLLSQEEKQQVTEGFQMYLQRFREKIRNKTNDSL